MTCPTCGQPIGRNKALEAFAALDVGFADMKIVDGQEMVAEIERKHAVIEAAERLLDD